MPKAKTRKKGTRQRSLDTRNATDLSSNVSSNAASAQSAKRLPVARRVRMQDIVMSAMVALGCWGLALSFVFFSSDANRYLFGVMAALMALIWSYRFATQLRKGLQQK
ncbi:hypothetical protein EPA93_37415 [Ktedonosporobacter rubrisoli]|uniref:Uncharacterized protein n=1 Tax=Ktedonosporobacter rubrisoli TaxID=2509675 RepID=A0A4P6K0L8_KTERU|nr:hypothetical protein [Ktedonosporobacter rubrisoli]QBD81353.1 hypothetical protein EPA93_37415 [Ktedonosporobacter rubrisoli]